MLIDCCKVEEAEDCLVRDRDLRHSLQCRVMPESGKESGPMYGPSGYSTPCSPLLLSPYPPLALSNKQSVYSHLLDELSHLYRSLPMNLDTNFLKAIRRGTRKDELMREQSLNQAVKVLIECKNKHIQVSLQQYSEQFSKYRNTKTDSPVHKSPTRRSPSKHSKNTENTKRKEKESLEERGRRIRRDTRSPVTTPLRPAEICFESQNVSAKKIREKNHLELPDIHTKSPNRREVTPGKFDSRQLLKCFTLNSRLEKKGLERKGQLHCFHITKNNQTDFSFQDHPTKDISAIPISHGKSQVQEEGFRRNRRVMLQLLREKQRNGFF